MLAIDNMSTALVLNTDVLWTSVLQIQGQDPLRVPGTVVLSGSQLKRGDGKSAHCRGYMMVASFA